jgi:hypothetical protein
MKQVQPMLRLVLLGVLLDYFNIIHSSYSPHINIKIFVELILKLVKTGTKVTHE